MNIMLIILVSDYYKGTGSGPKVMLDAHMDEVD